MLSSIFVFLFILILNFQFWKGERDMSLRSAAWSSATDYRDEQLRV